MIKRSSFFFLILCFKAVPVHSLPHSDQDILSSLLQDAKPIEHLNSRIDYYSDYFVKKGAPYQLGPLGEGPYGYYDQNPRYRFDVFDCTTYVETIISLSKANNVDEFKMWMDKIRYREGEVNFLTRNHFPSSDWTPNNIRNGVLVDITHDINAQVMSDWQLFISGFLNNAWVYIDKENWYRHISADRVVIYDGSNKTERLQALHNESAHVKNVWVRLAYLPLKTIYTHENPEEVLRKIPHGSVIQIVRPGWDLREYIGTRMLVSHQGFVVQRDNHVYFRHASSSPSKKRVVEERLQDYLRPYWERKGVYECIESGKGKNCVAGINILQVR